MSSKLLELVGRERPLNPSRNDYIDDYLIKVALKVPSGGIVNEFLSRVGIKKDGKNILFQCAYILKSRDEYYIGTPKMVLRHMEGKSSVILMKELATMKKIVHILVDYGFITVLEPEKLTAIPNTNQRIKILNREDSKKYTRICCSHIIPRKGNKRYVRH